MPDSFPDVLDRLEISPGDLTMFGSIREILRERLGTPASPVQISTAAERFGVLTGLAESVGFRITSHVLLEGRQRVRRTTLRDARGRFVRRGGRAVSKFLTEEIGF